MAKFEGHYVLGNIYVSRISVTQLTSSVDLLKLDLIYKLLK